MPEKSGMFDSTPDDPREYRASDFAEYFGRLLTNGVFNAGQYLNVSATGQDANVSLSPGAAWINGYAYSVYDAPITLPIQPAAAQDRIDRVILRLDTSTTVRAIRAIVLQGLPGTSPTPPALVRSGNIYDISLARILIKANTSIVLPTNITDERLDNTVCGLVNSLIKVDTTIFQQQWDAYMATLQNAGYVTGATFNAHVADYVKHSGFAVSAGTSTAYTVTLNPIPTALVAGMTFRFKAHVDSGANPTINPNGLGAKAAKKANGNAAAFKKDGIYTVTYDGTSAFILQGEGGGGTAEANQILLGKTASTDSGDVIGTMPDRGNNNIQATSTASVQIPEGYYNGSGQVTPPSVSAGGTIVLSSVIQQSPNNIRTYTKVKEIALNVGGVFRVAFTLASDSGSYSTYARIYKNGEPYGLERVIKVQYNETAFTQDLSFAPGDLVQIYAKTENLNQARVSNFTIAIALPVYGKVNLD